MSITVTETGMTITGPHIQIAQLVTLRAAVKLEGLGMKCSGRSAMASAKAKFNIVGNRVKVLNELTKRIDKLKEAF
jgi:hypothetical protein